MKFKKILNDCWWKINFKQNQLELFELEKNGVDVDEMIKNHFSENISKNIVGKIEITKEEMWPEPTINYSTDIIILNKNDLFEILYSFDKLSKGDKENVMKHLVQSEEHYLNQIRSDRLQKILDENLPTII